MVFWFCVASAGMGLLFVPFLTIGTQGHSKRPSTTSVENLQGKDVKFEDVKPASGVREQIVEG